MAYRARGPCSKRQHWIVATRIGSLITVIGLISGCASIHHFAVTPRATCEGNTVKAAWSADGRVVLTSTPKLKGTGEQPSSGERQFVVHRPTHFELQAHGLFESKKAEADVDVAAQRHGYSAVAECRPADRLITTQIKLGQQISKQFTVQAIGNQMNRALHVAKDGRAETIPAHGQSDSMAGLHAQGTWHLATPLKPAETCESALRSIRQRLSMQLTLACKEASHGGP